MEIAWRPIPFAPRYEASECGKIRNGSTGRVLRPSRSGYGYVHVKLGRQGCTKVHRAVAAAFIGPRPPGMQINHRDRNKQNNAVENLEYVTRAENMRHASEAGWFLQPPEYRTSRLTGKLTTADVLAVRDAYASGEPRQAIADRFNINRSHVRRIAKRIQYARVR